MPPHNSARSLRAMPQPQRMPNSSPTSDRANETNPIMPMGERMLLILLMPKKANETHTASASILVAIASISTVYRRVGSN